MNDFKMFLWEFACLIRQRVEIDPGCVRCQQIRAPVLVLVADAEGRGVLGLRGVVRGHKLK